MKEILHLCLNEDRIYEVTDLSTKKIILDMLRLKLTKNRKYVVIDHLVYLMGTLVNRVGKTINLSFELQIIIPKVIAGNAFQILRMSFNTIFIIILTLTAKAIATCVILLIILNLKLNYIRQISCSTEVFRLKRSEQEIVLVPDQISPETRMLVRKNSDSIIGVPNSQHYSNINDWLKMGRDDNSIRSAQPEFKVKQMVEKKVKWIPLNERTKTLKDLKRYYDSEHYKKLNRLIEKDKQAWRDRIKEVGKTFEDESIDD